MDKLYDVFISYSSKDDKLAIAMCNYLESNQLKCWIAPRNILTGKNYADCIIDGIQASKIMVVILSENAINSNHVRSEVDTAFSNKQTILPFRISDINPPKALNYFLGQTQWLNAFENSPETYFEILYQNIVSLLNGTDAPIVTSLTIQPVMFRDPFSFKGRIRRREYCLSFMLFCFISLVILIILIVRYSANKDDPYMKFAWYCAAVFAFSFWFFIAQGAKRSHDVSKSGWYQFIPFYNFYICFAEGDSSRNLYGSNPKQLLSAKVKRPVTYIFVLVATIVLLVSASMSSYKGNVTPNTVIDSDTIKRVPVVPIKPDTDTIKKIKPEKHPKNVNMAKHDNGAAKKKDNSDPFLTRDTVHKVE